MKGCYSPSASVLIFILAVSGFLGSLLAMSTPQLSNLGTQRNKVKKTKFQKIKLIHADIISYDRFINPDIQSLRGNVELVHQGVKMNCDSAWLNESNNSFQAFGNVRINQGDTIRISAEYLDYNGLLRYLRLRNNVVLEKKNTSLYTDSLDYDRINGIGYYFDGGTIADSENTLNSIYGTYNTHNDDALFEQDVVLTNPEYEIKTDRLQYNTKNKISIFIGPTVVTSDSSRIETTYGAYDSNRDLAVLIERSKIFYKTDKTLEGDSVFYNRKLGQGEALGNVILTDTTRRATLMGEYTYYDEHKNYAFATERAFLMDYSKKDTLFTAADTIELISLKMPKIIRIPQYDSFWAREDFSDSLSADSVFQQRLQKKKVTSSKNSNRSSISSQNTPLKTPSLQAEQKIYSDSLDGRFIYTWKNKLIGYKEIQTSDSIQERYVKAYRHMRLYRNDLQATADSLFYAQADSLINLYGQPKLWHKDIQLSADTLCFKTKGDSIDYVEGKKDAWIIQYIDIAKSNQLKANHYKAYLRDSVLRRFDAYENVEIINFLQDGSTKKYYEMVFQKAKECHTEFDSIGNNERSLWVGDVEGTAYPISKATPDMRKLPGYNWAYEDRPKDRYDLFVVSDDEYHRPSLRELSRYDGQKATQEAYALLARYKKEKQEANESVRKNAENKKQQKEAAYLKLSENDYIHRLSKKEIEQKDQFPFKLFPLWLYSNKEECVDSAINQSFMMMISKEKKSEKIEGKSILKK